MSRTKTKTLDRILSFALALMMIMAMVPVNAIAAEENSSYGTVTTYTGGTVTNNGTANVEVLVEQTTLQWVEKNSLRNEGWWVGICVTAPEGFSADATYKSKNNPVAEYGEEKSFAEKKDGENYIQLWFPVSPDSLNKFASEGRNLTLMYAFDWDANGNYEQEITFSVVPSEKIVLMKGEDQVYPAVVNYGTVTTYTGGTVSENGTANVEVLVEETTLQWVEANPLRGEGWWVGICVTAPKGFSADATYKSKNNPAAEYGEVKSFAEKKDGDDYIQLWFPVSPESLEKFASESRNLTLMYAFDWDANGNYEQEIAFSVVPSEKIVLMKGENQVYPVLKSTVTVSKNDGGTVSLNGDTTGTLIVKNGTTVNVVIEAADSYQISKVTINGQETVVDDKSFTGTIENITADTTVSVIFVKLYTVTVSGNDRGTVSTDPEGQGGSVTVVDGSKVTVTATPESGYRVSGVKINGVDQTVTGANNSGYTVELTADTEYSVEVTFAPNIYKVEKSEAENGDFEIKNPSVEHGGSTDVVITPDVGYTVDTFEVEGATVSNLVKDATGIWFTVSDIKSDVKVVVTFKATAKTNIADVSKDAENIALRKNETLFVVKDGDVITFKTEKTGMRMYGDLGLIAGDATTQTIIVPGDTTITSIELYYQADDELYADWHVVEMNAIKVVIDVAKTESILTPNAANENGYYNSNVTFDVKAEDKGDFSGLALVEYWITLNKVDGKVFPLYEYKDGEEVKAIHEDTFTVDASVYNSKDVKVTLRVVDRAGNEEIVEKEIKINSTKPTVSLAINGTQNDNAQEGYYNDQRTLTITVIDREDTFSQVNAAKGLEIHKNGALIKVAASDITWKHTEGSNQYEGAYVFAEDAHYQWSFTYTNLAGLSNENITVDADSKDIYEFYVDKDAPHTLNVSYETDFIDVFLENATFGFYKAPVKVTIEATDDTAGIEQFEYYFTLEDGTGEINKTIVNGDNIKRDDNRAYVTFSINPQFRGKVAFSATDRAGRATNFQDNRVVVVGTIAPGVTVTWSPAEGHNSKYFNEDRTATIEIEEANFFAQDVEDGLLNITAHIVYNDGSSKDETYKPEFTFEDGKYVATITFSEEADYTFDVVYTDRSGNVYDEYPAEKFTIDKTAPAISVKYDNNTAVNENQFKAERTATITVVEHNFNKNAMNVIVNENETQVEWIEDEDVADTYFAVVPFPGNAHYTFGVKGKDLSDNANDGVATADGTVAPWEFTVDKSGPVGLKISYEPTFVGTLLEGVTFGFYKAPVTVKIEATDDISGIDYFTYSYTVQEGASSINVGMQNVKVDANGADFITFEIPAQFRGFVSFTATNKAGVSASTADTNAVVVDDIAPGIQVVYGNYDAQNDKYYKADRTATITIEEANFFAKDIEDGLLVITRKAVANDGTVKEETLAPQFTKIENSDKYVATISFDQDADYTFDVKYTDRSGNIYDGYDADEFTVDKIKPVISIEKANGAYFNADRTAKITVVEHNFRASDFSIRDAEGNLTITATDYLGAPIDLSSKGYEAYLKNDDNWTPVAADTWETEITFDIEGNYTIGATYTDLAGNEQETPISDTFCVDKSTPENLKISYNPTFVGTLLETITFGFYKAPVTVTIEATDDIAGVDYFVYSYIVAADASTTNTGKSDVTVQATRDGSTNRWFATFDIPAQFRGNVSFTAYDKATNDISITDGNVVVVDNVAPGVNVVYDNNDIYDDGYFRSDRTATITINEANFFAQDIEDGLLVITVEKTLNDGTYTSTKMSPVFTKNGDIYTAEILFDENADYTFDIKYTDRSGNVYDSYEKDVFTIDKIDPVIDVSYDTEALYENGNQFRTNRTATIKITEHNFRADYVVAKVMASGNEVARYAEDLKNDANWKHYTSAGVEVQNAADGDVHVAIIEYTEEAHYTFEIGCTDKAGRTNEGVVNYGDSVSPTAFTIDKSAPTDMEIKIDNVSVAGSMTDLAFNKFYDATVAVKLSANCDISGLQSLKYQKVANASDYKADGVWTDYNAETGIVVEPSEKLIIYFRAEDRAGNVKIIRSTGIVVDNQKPVGETKAPEIDILPAAPNANGIHNGNVDVDIKVVDPKYAGATANANGHYSGLNKITYKIYTTDTAAIEEDTLLDLVSKTNGAVFDADRLVSAWSGKITIDSAKFNSNNVIVEVTATDNAGNTRTTTTVAGNIKIDITAPTIDVTYDNNNSDNEKFFKDNRTATIVVTERNFNADDVKVTITNTDGVIPTISRWEKTEGTGNLDDTRWTATITYASDGDYTFDISYTDLADNACAGAQYAESVAPTEFTVDKTLPVVSVSYSNNDAKNGKYFAAPRTATVVINEHNFDVNRVTFTQTAFLDGATITIPTATWTHDEDIHTATIAFTADGDYTFDVSVTDIAGNVSDAANYGNSVAAKDFVVDQTILKPTIGGIDNGKAYKDAVVPTISFNDVNYDSYEVKLVRTRMGEKNVDVTDEFIKSVTEQTQGGNGSYDTFEKKVENDGIYTLTVKMTDKAGNDATEEYTFTVNRFGSVYEYSDYLISLIKDGGQYITKNGDLAITDDLVITEYNADRLVQDTLKIIITRDGETIDVKYTSSPEITNGVEVGSSGWYQYVYTISKDNFTVDGVYNITITSQDATENTSTSVPDNSIDKDGNRIIDTMTFTVDTTAPEIRNIINLDKKIVNAQELTVKYTIVDVGGLKQIEVMVDGKTVDTITEFGDALNNFTGVFTLSESSEAQTVRIKVTDKAGNVTDTASEGFNPGDLYIFNDTITVSTNAFVRWYANKPLFWGSIGGVIVLVGLLGFLVAAKRRKKESEAK